jgi:NAD(P)H dehydrogenase (quinone)
MAYVGSVIDDTKKLLGREPLLLKDWAKLHANELFEAAGRESGVGSNGLLSK